MGTNVRSYTDEQLLNKVKSLKTFRFIPMGLWILGVRSNEDSPDKFDDKFYVFHHQTFIKVLTGTTNPGVKVLKGYKRYNSKGAFVMASNFWFYDLWKKGYHKKRMPALVQVNEVYGYRDGNYNSKSEQIGKLVKGFFGINFHKSNYGKIIGFVRKIIGGWSAGCQVANNSDDYDWLMGIIDKGQYVTYCLIDEFET